MKRIIFDGDSTTGVEGRAMDNALALFYLLGKEEEAQVLGLLCNHGAISASELYRRCHRLLKDTGLSHIPLYSGAERGEDPRSESAQFIVDMANRFPGQVSYLCLGSLTNLYGAWLLDRSVFDKLGELVLMGGIVAPVDVGGRSLEEQNFSVDVDAAACVLLHGRNIAVVTGNSYLPASFLSRDEFLQSMCMSENLSGMYIAKKYNALFEGAAPAMTADGTYCRDAVAAVYLLHPELFHGAAAPCRVTKEYLALGWLVPVKNASMADNLLTLPEPRDRESFQRELYRGWQALRLNVTDEAFSCKGVFLDKLLQPAILAELAKAPCHGFRLIQNMERDGLIRGIDPTGVYRMLKSMERNGYLSSCWNMEGAVPKRVFQLTTLGKYCLANWRRTLRQYAGRIDVLLAALPEDGPEA